MISKGQVRSQGDELGQWELRSVRKVIKNIGWLSVDRIIRMGVGLIVGVWVARYLGPAQFGLLNYAMAFVGIFSVLSTLGMDQILVKEIVNKPERLDELMGTGFLLKLIGGFLAVLSTIVMTIFMRPNDFLTLGLIAVIGTGFIFQSVDVIDFWFQASIQSKYTVYARNSAFLFIAAVKIALILGEASLIWFAIAGLAEVVIGSIGLVYHYHKHKLKIGSWRVSLELGRELLRAAWPLMLTGMAIAIYMKIDQVMLGSLVDDQEVGVYAAATKISEVWYFIPSIITSSIYPVLVSLYEESRERYLDLLKQIMGLFFWGTLSLSLVVSLFSGVIIEMLYGPAYARSAGVLTIHIYAGIVTSMSIVFSQKFILDGTTKISFYGTLVGAAANIVLNLWLLPLYGAYGAAVATVISYLVPMVFQTVFFDKQIGFLFVQAIASPIIYTSRSFGRFSKR